MEHIIQSEILKKLNNDMKKVVERIKSAIDKKQPILIRHHNDADGYTGGVALEKAIIPLLHKKHDRERDLFYFYTRAPCTAPFYSIADATRDITNFLNSAARFGNKHPLIIIIDNGSSEQDIPAIKKVKVYNADVIVIDHHPHAKEIDTLVEIHVNPHKVGSTYDFSAGMLCAEIGHALLRGKESGKEHFEFVAAVSALADRVRSKEAQEYLKLSEKKYNLTEEFMKHVAECLDFEAFILGTIESRKLIDDLLNPESPEQKKIVEITGEELEKRTRKQMLSTLKYVKLDTQKEKIIASLEVEKVHARNEYPRTGKIIGKLQDNLINNKQLNPNKKPVITLGLSKESINFRCSVELEKFDVNQIIALIEKKLPESQVNGGGHRVAGSIKFIEASCDEVMGIVKEYLKTV